MKKTSIAKSIDPHEIGMIAACLSDTAMTSLYEQCTRRGIGYIGVLDKISEWALEFYNQYDEKMQDWEIFESSTGNIFNAICWDDFVMMWAEEKLKAFKQS